MIQEATEILVKGKDLTAPQMEAVMEEIMTGKTSTPQIIAFLNNLNTQGETAEELAAAVGVMRRHTTKIRTKHKVILDTCGTGGDRKHTFNISTAVAFVVSAAGVAVAKHGNRSVSSASGSADVMEALGININMSKEGIERCLDEIGIAFLFAPNFHPAMKYAFAARKAMGVKTIFNFLGPLSNPANATHQLVGVYDQSWAHNLAYALGSLGTEHTLVVCGRDNLDEITTADITDVFEVRRGKVNKNTLNYADFDFNKANPGDFTGQDAACNAKILMDILEKKEIGPKRDIVLLNAGAAIYTADKAASIKEGIKLAVESIDSGRALEKLELLKEYSHKS